MKLFLLNDIYLKKAMQQKGSDNNIILADSAFFMKILDADKALSDADCRALASNYLETSAPLPMEQLMWGVSRRGGKVLVYAAASHRLLADSDISEELMSARRVFPSFAAVFAAPFEDGKYCYENGGEAVEFEVSGGEISDFDIYDGASNAEGAAGFSLNVSESTVGPKFNADFKDAKRQPVKWRISNSRMRNLCDVRSRAQLAEISKRMLRGALAGAFFAFAILAFVCMAVWQISLMVSASNVASVRADLDAISPKAKAVEAMSEQLAFMGSLSKKPLYNVRLLAIANRARSPDVEFSKTSATSPNELQIFGKADSAGSVNKFEEELGKMPQIKSVRVSVPSSKSGNAQFEINITFRDDVR